MKVLLINGSPVYYASADGKEKYGLPEVEEHVWTNFIR